MKANLEKIENNLAILEIQVDPGKFEEAMEKSYRKNVKNISVPGFRKGRAPRKIVEARYGEGIFYEDAINFAVPEAYSYAVKETGIKPVDQPKIEIVQIGQGKPFIFKAEVTVKPEVKLGEYKGIEAEKIEFEVTDEAINKELEYLRQKNARLVAVEDRPVQEGDIAIIDFEGFIDGRPLEGGKNENYSLEIGSKSFVPGFEDQLIGVRAGEEKEIKITFPEGYRSEELSGKDAVFKVRVKEIKKKELPELDDEFAKDVSEFETLKELKDDIENKLKQGLEEISRSTLESTVINRAVENAQVDIPQVMIENEIDILIQDFSSKLSYSGTNLEQYLKYNNLTEEDLRNRFKDEAYHNVKRALVLEAIAEVEGIQATDDEIENKVKEIAEKYNQNPEEFRKKLGERQVEIIKDNIVMKKTVDFLIQNSKIKVKKQSKENETAGEQKDIQD